MGSYLNELLKEKVNTSTEIEIHLFEFCNLNCSFCGQDHDSRVGMDTIPEKAEQVIAFMKRSPLTSHTINIMGGEIFNDLIEDSVFEEYLAFYHRINNYCKENQLTVRFNWVTNLIFSKNILNVFNLIESSEGNSFISTSYDFSGRGLNINRYLQFRNNLTLLKQHIGVIGFVLTKPSIKKLLNDQDKFFKEELYPNYPLYFDYYVPEKSSDKMMPSEEEMLKAFNYIAEHYPKVEPIKSMLENTQNQMTCFSLNKVTILPDGKEVTCRYLKYEKEDFISEVNYHSNENIIEAHLERNQCLTCPYYHRCQFRCFVQADWRRLERLENNQCFIRCFFDEQFGEKLVVF